MSWNIIPLPEWIASDEQATSVGQYLSRSCRETGLALDTETTGLEISKDRALMYSLSDGLRRFAGLVDNMGPLKGTGHHPSIKGLLTDPQITKIGTNIKFDKHMLANVGIELAGRLHDTIVMDWLYNENRYSHGLKETAKDYCGLQMEEFKIVFPMRKAKKPTKKNPSGVPGETPGDAIQRVMLDPETRPRAIEYAGLDAYASIRVHNYLYAQLRDQRMFGDITLWDHFINVEVPFTTVLWNMERRGFTISTGHLKTQMEPMEQEMEYLSSEVAKLAGWPVLLTSPKQLISLFFGHFGLIPNPKFVSKKTNEPSTNEEALEDIAENSDHPIAVPVARLIQQHRKLKKIYGTYIQGILDWVDQNLRLRTTLNQAGTVTGRLSSRDPNCQNIPRPDKDKFGIRQAFIADVGMVLIIADYDQLEMKLMAHFSEDKAMISAILEGKDLHCFTVSLMFGEDYDEVVAAKKGKHKDENRAKLLVSMRQAAKAIGFGLIYGIGPHKLSRQLTNDMKREVTIAEAQTNINRYFSVFPGVRDFINNTHEECSRTESVRTLDGRFRRLPQINASDKAIAAEARRQSVNTIIQGTAADITKHAMILCENDSELQELGVKQLLQVHDEIIMEGPDNDYVIDRTKIRMKYNMEHPYGPDFNLSIPLTTEANCGYSWTDAK